MEASPSDRKPPYGGFRTFWNFIEQLHEHRPLPQFLDKSVMGNRGGSARAELYIALRFLGLIDANKAPTDKLEALTEDPTMEKLRMLVEDAYAPVIAMNLATATPSQVAAALADLGATSSTVERSRAFFLHAADATGIEYGRLLKSTRSGSKGARKSRSTTRRTRERVGGGGVGDESARAERTGLPPLVAALLADLPANGQDWDAAAARQWLSLFVPALAYGYKLDLKQIKESP
jgi:hypothetical protein